MLFRSEKTITRVVDNFSAYLRRAWEDAKREKHDVEQKILENMRAIKGEYNVDKLNDIRKLGGSEIFMMLTETKTRHCEAWVKDILFQPNNIPWEIEPTPIPDLPGDLEEDIIENFMSQTVDAVHHGVTERGSHRPELFEPEVKGGHS